MPKLKVNGKEVEFEQGMTVLQACELGGEEIPRFCYHERLSIAGNCRMCLVQIEGGPPKPAASCAMPATDGMVVHTNSPMVKKAREGVMEFLLINHPLDCPICDQGGECDLQDQAMTYGRGTNRFHENKRSVKDKDMGPLIKTQMTRCIHCTRCIRFSTEIAGVEELGATGRGETMEVGTYVEKALISELSGNMIDLCPVGALTSRPYAFQSRPWELKKTETIDVLDAVGSNIRVDSRGKEVLRVLPRVHEDINEEWISDKTRFACDGLKLQRLDRPYVRKNGKLKPTSWEEAISVVVQKLRSSSPERIAALAGNLMDVESMYVLKKLILGLGSPNFDCRTDQEELDRSQRGHYVFNTTIAGIEKADFCLLIGTNPRLEAPLINARLRKQFLKGKFKIARIGASSDLTYPVIELGDSPEVLVAIAKAEHPIADQLKAAQYPMIIIGSHVYARTDHAAIQEAIDHIAAYTPLFSGDWNGFNVLHHAASRVGGLDIGFVPQAKGKGTKEILAAAKSNELDLLYLLGSDEIPMDGLDDCFIVYQGHHGDKGAHLADVILPGAAYTEKSGIYVNTEGRVQYAVRAVFPVGEAREDWQIITDIANRLGQGFGFSDLDECRRELIQEFPHFAQPDAIMSLPIPHVLAKKSALKISKEPFIEFMRDFYFTDPISRASKTMSECSALHQNLLNEAA